MIYKILKQAVEEIKMSDTIKNRIIKNCYSRISDKEEFVMRKTTSGFKKILPIIAVSVICIISVGTVVANHLRGFRDVTKGTAVVGTVYDEANEMIKINAKVEENLVVSVFAINYTKPPYIEFDTIDISSYKIVDNSGNVIDEGSSKSTSEFENGKVTFELSLNDIEPGEYKLVINEFTGAKKADQPLPIKGIWEISFVK